MVPSRSFGQAQSVAGTAWRVRDLGLSAPISGRPSTLIPTPYAINQHGDVALAVCPALGCGNAPPPNTVSAYMYDYRCNRLISLATFPGQSSPRPIDQYIPQALNERGQVVGSVVRSAGQKTVGWPVIWTRRGFDGSTIARLDTRPADQGTAFGITNFGVAVGSVYSGVYRANSFEFGTAVRFTGAVPVLLAPYATDAFAINDAGVAVGDILGEATVFQGGVAFPIPTQDQCPPAFDVCDQNFAIAINKVGAVLGNYVTNYFDIQAQNYVGFLWQNPSFSTLAPACFDTDCPVQLEPNVSDYVLALNDNNDFVGYFDGAPWVSFSPVGDANGLLPPNSGWQITSVAAINDRRQIVGQGYHAGYGTALRAFLLEPAR
jgi:hypothetical protein